ncbi:hypothetical protein AA0311_2051 [Asaia bogorensis NBRC 16594]|nr:hypothetical protein AA0311_2051 [Asaia bogorensis NBRC 16594]
MTDADQAQKHRVTTRLLLSALKRVYHKDGGFGVSGTSDHVTQKLAMAGRIDNNELAPAQMERNTGGIDSYALIALDLKRVEKEAPFDSKAALAAALNNLSELSVLQAVRVVKQTANKRRLAVIDMANNNDRRGSCAQRGWEVVVFHDFAHGSEITRNTQTLERVF